MQPVSVNYRTGDFTAHTPGDYVGTSGTLTFAPGVSTQNIEITVPATTVASDPKVGLIGLDSPVNAVLGGIGPGLGLFGINDSNPKVVASAVSTSVNVKSGLNATVGIHVSLTNVSDQLTSVGYALADGTAVFGTDYYPSVTSGTVYIGAGATTDRVIYVPVHGVGAAGTSKTFTLNLSNPGGPVEVGNATATVTINVT